ncbi:MAG: Kelch repeat-containing protein [Hyphomonas sp.]
MPESLKFRLSRREACLGLAAALGATACKGPGNALARPSDAPPAGWSMGEALPFPVQEIYPCLHDGAIHLAGGFVAENGQITGPAARHHAWRPDGLGWREAPPLPVARHHPHLVSYAGALYAIGGFQASSPAAMWEMQGTGWRMDAATGRWETAPALPRPCAEAVVLARPGGGLHLMGGRSPGGTANAAWGDQTDQTHHFVLTSPEGRWEKAAPRPHRAQQRGGRRDCRAPACDWRTQRDGRQYGRA